MITKHFTTEERQRFLLACVRTLKQLHMENRRPHMLVIEEAHNFLPQLSNSPLKQELGLVAVEGRKFGLGMLISDQRSANVDKTVIGQAGIMLLHRARGVADLNTYQDISDLIGAKKIARKLQVGEAIAILGYDVNFDPQPVKIKRRETVHGGDTPALKHTPGVVSPAALTSLAELLAQHTEDEESEQAKLVKSLKQQLVERDERLADLTRDNERLAERVTFLSTLKVTLDHQSPAVLDVEQINTEAIVASGVVPPAALDHAQIPPAGPPVVVPTVESAAHADDQTYRSPRATARAVDKQERQFTELLKSLRLYPAYHRALLRFLLEYEGHTYSLHEVARYIGYASSTLGKNPPTKLLRAGLIKRHKAGRSIIFGSTARETLAKQFPDLNLDALLGRLLKASQ